jgi:hypothetical protein
MVVTLTSSQNALVVMGELYQVYTVAFAIIGVDFLSAF